MHWVRGLAAAACAMAFCTGLSAPPRVDYTLRPMLVEGALQAMQVDLVFRGDADGETTLHLPDAWGGETELYRAIEQLAVVAGATLADGEGPAERRLRHAPGARIHVRYRIVQDREGEPAAGQGNPYRPIVQPTYFHLIGSAALITPGIEDAAIVRLHRRGFPRAWSFASDLEHTPLSLGNVAPTITVGGDYRVWRAPHSNIRLAIRGAWTFADQDFLGEVDRILTGQRDFWGDEPTPFLVTVTQLTASDPGQRSIGGTGLGDAFAFFATANAPSAQLTRTLSHEGTHTWIPGRLGGVDETTEIAQYWFSEGFTDFYAGRTLVRSRIWTPRQFADDFNEMLSAYAQSPVRLEPNARIVSDFWSDGDVQSLPYQRGRLLATLWDARLRTAGAGDLDDVVLEMKARARAEDARKAVDLVQAVLAARGYDPATDIARFVDQGEPIFLPADVFAPCGAIATRTVPRFHRGFDIAATQANGNVIAGVVPAGPAYAAGMRDGMVLVRRDGGEIGNAEVEIAYVVRDGDAERTLRYMPRGEGSFVRQSFELAQDLSGDMLSRCLAVLGG